VPRDFFTGRHAGLLVPLFSIPSRESWGIGEIPDIVRIACWMDEAGLSFLQLLPLNEMAEGQNSPYSALSAMAIDPLFIAASQVPDLDALGGERTLTDEEQSALRAAREAPAIRYPAVRAIKNRVFRVAFDRFMIDEWGPQSPRAARLTEYIQRERWWLDDYTLFRAIHAREDRRHWRDGEPGLRDRDPHALERAREELAASQAKAARVDRARTQEDERERLAWQVGELRREVAALRGSRSWRVTAPLRRLYEWAGAARKRT
jgi:4-alpha-glucanotransferase